MASRRITENVRFSQELSVTEWWFPDARRFIDPTQGIDSELLPSSPMTDENIEDARRVYAMVTNIDDNLKKLFMKVEDLGIAENTIIIFMTGR